MRQARPLILAGRRPFRRLSAKSRSLCGIVSILICAIVPAGAQQPQQPSQSVGTVYAERKPIAKTLDFVGRIEARERVVVQARVKGYLEAVLFKEGEFVKKGDALYQIEKGLFQAAVEDAQGALERAKAAKVLSTVELQRKEELLEKQAGTVVARDEALAARRAGKRAQYCQRRRTSKPPTSISATPTSPRPIDGKIGRTNITKGNVVGPDSGAADDDRQPGPDVRDLSGQPARFPAAQLTGRAARYQGSSRCKLRFADGSIYDQVGHDQLRRCVGRPRHRHRASRAPPLPIRTARLIDGQLVSVDARERQRRRRRSSFRKPR